MRDRYDFSEGVVGKYSGKIAHQYFIENDSAEWKHPSVKALAQHGNPIEIIVEQARALVLEAIDSQGMTLPIDPFKLAHQRSIEIIPRSDVPNLPEARTICGHNNRPVIEYNPNRPRARVRFSICHELAHTLFPDWSRQVRNRSYHNQTSSIEYELEMLCNLAAAEMLLPIGSIQEDLSELHLSVDAALSLRPKYEASVEAILLRLAGLSSSKCAVFAALADEGGEAVGRYRLEYVKSIHNWDSGLRRGIVLPPDTEAAACTAIGYTASAKEEWVEGQGKLSIEMVGVSPYPNRAVPRIVGLIKPLGSTILEHSPIHFVRGDALQPRGSGERIVAHVVNDQTPNWGAGFGKALKDKWPNVQLRFKSLFDQTRGSKLGLTLLSKVSEDIFAFQMVSQRGYGPSSNTRLRYGALRQCLIQLRDFALNRNASVHMPRIGSGEAGGSWGIVSNLIIEELCAKGVPVTIYDLPGNRFSVNKQFDLFTASFH